MLFFFNRAELLVNLAESLVVVLVLFNLSLASDSLLHVAVPGLRNSLRL